jgi:phosphatidylserine decarboxylase
MNLPIAGKEFLPYGLAVVGINLVAFFCDRWFPRYHIFFTVIIFLCLAVFMFFVYFFRDPDRPIKVKPGTVLAPADGKVVVVKKIEEKVYMGGTANQVSIFMSPLDMHVQRAPLDGTIEHVKHHPGKFMRAFLDQASIENEQNHIGMLCQGQRVFLKQIAGIIARRTVVWVKPGDEVRSGDRIGMVKFGSRVDIFLPDNADLQVSVGDRVKAGLTILGRLKT